MTSRPDHGSAPDGPGRHLGLPIRARGAEPSLPFDAVVLAGGRAERLGTPKPGLVVGGRPLLEHALAATVGAARTVVVGPDELAAPGRYVRTREDPPFGGPVAGIAAGLAALPDDGRAPWVLVLACDVPRAAEAVPALLAAARRRSGEVAVHAVRDGRAQWLVGLYERAALDAALDALPTVQGASVRRLLAGLPAIGVPDDTGATDDVDTWEDAREQERRLAAGAPAVPGAPPAGTPDDGRRPR
ncbi:NTP transferase domain-containing protein [Cellulosimicrobium sp. TH-20]|uniref:molybdenum cofactor guanylyltransferase n=1 Tax=Cellulosimicrobium sp. TH-20 TaxID=1980001 RepID=UPI0021068BEF